MSSYIPHEERVAATLELGTHTAYRRPLVAEESTIARDWHDYKKSTTYVDNVSELAKHGVTDRGVVDDILWMSFYSGYLQGYLRRGA